MNLLTSVARLAEETFTTLQLPRLHRFRVTNTHGSCPKRGAHNVSLLVRSEHYHMENIFFNNPVDKGGCLGMGKECPESHLKTCAIQEAST